MPELQEVNPEEGEQFTHATVVLKSPEQSSLLFRQLHCVVKVTLSILSQQEDRGLLILYLWMSVFVVVIGCCFS